MLDFSLLLESKPIIYTMYFLASVTGAIWIASIYWVYQDIFDRTKNTLLQLISVIVAILFPFFGLIIYSLIKPPATIEETRIQKLDERILKKQFSELHYCRKCHKSVDKHFVFCPHCHFQLKNSCPECESYFDAQFAICPYCGHKTNTDKIDSKKSKKRS